jgi:polyisoprenoid-binding protein YceI
MAIGDGRYELGPGSGELLVKTTRTGLGARAGHDLTIEVTRWHASIVIDTARPSASAVNVDIEAGSLEARAGTGGLKPLTDPDRAQIRANIQQKILRTGQYPAIMFRSMRVEGAPESFTVEGDLTIAGTTQPVTLHGRIADGRVHGAATVVQSRWGIRPYTGFFGALRLSDEVSVEFSGGLTPAG